ncbi:MAG: methyltransferase domain-containing protein [Parvibaculum sp.]|uniref:class I SAM-dependent methyltransferase n=1 Tax=Parvibaculum sp. TaxID=2024848 RepID=UPI0025FC1D1E|nr:methyltransferase domain-containing protein [Parvibaculum sp.]MCE9650391.1 methyltransferase domain-containing protein [Parvibaculum sp.]
MSESATINLATVGTAELEAMSVQVFASCLDTMSGEAIARFRRMRKLSNSHRVALEKYLVDHPEKRPGGPGEAPPPTKAGAGAGAAAAKSGSPAKTGKPAGTPKRSPFPEFKKRLRAWWEGVDIKDLDNPSKDNPSKASAKSAGSTPAVKKAAPAKPQAAAAPTATATDGAPAMTRVEMLQQLWGEGFSLPGGEAFALKLAQGVDLPTGQPCLDIAAGLGGGVRALANHYKITVDGFESDPALAEAARALSERDGTSDTAPIVCANPLEQDLAAKRYSAIFTRETLFTVEERKKLLTRLALSLRPMGSLVLTDFMLTDRKAGTEAMHAWRAAEPQKPIPYTVDEYAELLDQLRFNVRACDDLSTEYAGFIQAGWKRLHTCLQTAKLPPETATMLMTEGNVWLARSRALESGQLRLMSIKAALRAVKTTSEPVDDQ